MARGGGEEKTRRKRKRGGEEEKPLSPLISFVASATSAIHAFLTTNDLQLHPSQTLTLESKINSTAISLTNLHSHLQTQTQTPTTNSLKTLTPLPFPPPPRNKCWFLRFLATTVSSDSSNPRWIEAFGMSKSAFLLLLQTLTPSLQNSSSASILPVNYILGVGLFRLAHGAKYKSIGRRFGIDSSTACRAFYEVCKAVNDRLGHLFEFESDTKRIVEGFGWISLPNCCGVLGFSRFGENGEVIVQGLVDSEGRFLDVSAGWPGSMSPVEVLPQTKLFSRVEEVKELLNGPSMKLRDGDSVPQYILGDSSCLPLSWLITPYPLSNDSEDNLTSAEKAFNSAHSRGMGLVSAAFKRVRARWGLLSMKWKESSVEFVPSVVVASCLLHNFLTKCSEVVPFDIEDENQSDEERFPVFEGKGDENVESIRDALSLQLSPKVESQVILELYQL